MPVAGKIDDTGVLDSDRLAERRPLSVYIDLACGPHQTGERPHELALAVSLDARKANHLAARDVKI